MLKGIKLDGKKEMSLDEDIMDISNPSLVYIPLMNGNTSCSLTVKKGKKVKKGSVIGIREDIDFPILSSVSGTVVDIKKCMYFNGKNVDCVVISNDKKETLIKKKEIKDITTYTKEEFVDLLKNCAVTGMGGSDFPTFLKYKGEVETLIINAVECEPYLTADMMLVNKKADLILESINAIMKINNIKNCFIAYKKNNIIVKDSFLKYIDKYENISLYPVKNIYPMGWERYIVKAVLKKDYDKFPSDIKVVVNNVTTIFSIYKALKYQRAISKRIVTISGEGFTKSINVLVKIGTNISSVIKKIGKYEDNNLRFIVGGPMMGKSLSADDVIISKSVGAITIISDTIDEKVECISCGRCIKKCPANICPVFIFKNIDDKDMLKKLHPESCIECGICSYICPSKIELTDAVKLAKEKVKE